MAQDSPLSIAANLTGILTFVFAVMAGFYARALSLRSAIDTQAEIRSALEKIDFLETETDMLNNAHLASQIRQPDRTYGKGDFNYFQSLYGQALARMRGMDRELRRSAVAVTGGSYDRISRVKTAASWMKERSRVHKGIEERRAESGRVFQIQLAMLSAKIDELSYRQNHHNASCRTVVEEIGSLHSAVETHYNISPSIPPTPSATASSPTSTPPPEKVLTIRIPSDSKPIFHDRLLMPNDATEKRDIRSYTTMVTG